ncbi:hypothetical protein Lnau_0664 [Legionella nautarum]|uniref:Uncharacterized protein n=1 Tax=Legionella nautarum TaxID=45070 RepID=A0A0W0WYV8_9GAMM|nr:ankyrin repeat domain-containing protein [Legionella nautarum]KTD37474.1 hypothetical protein Lnau_0664 [Legionella nautarum]
MTTIILVNYIHYDGIGDFQHWLDITKKIHPLALESGIKIVPLILCLANLEEIVKERLNNLNMDLKPFIFTMPKTFPRLEELNQQFSEFVTSNVELQNDLENALTIIQVSSATTKYQKETLLRYCYPGIPIVNIAEHSGLRTPAAFSPIPLDFDKRDKPGIERNITDRWMGLPKSPESIFDYGIKLESPLSISKEETLLSFTNQDYVRTLLKKESGELIEKRELTDFMNGTQIIPAYLQDEPSIMKFILYCIEHEKNSDKDMLFHINISPLFDPRLRYAHDIEELDKYSFSATRMIEDKEVLVPKLESMLIANGFQNYGFDNMEINLEVNVNGAIRTIHFGSSPTAKKTVRILSGFYLEDGDYNKLYHIADSIVGISGDNTFEKALSHNKLPFLQSDNKYTFEPAMRALYEISLASLPDASSQLKHDLSNYFLNNNMRLDNETRREEILKTNWTEMQAALVVVGEYLQTKYNFYNHLQSIFYEALLHASAQKGDVDLLKIIHQHAPDINIAIPNKQGQTALELATLEGHTAYVKEFSALFKQQADTVEKEKSSSKPLGAQEDSFFFQNPATSVDEAKDKKPQSDMSANRDHKM